MSDWAVEDFSLEAFVCDLETVIETTKLPRFALFGLSQGCAVALAYAVRNPERVSHLVLYGGYARGKRRRGSDGEIAEADALQTLIRDGWGRDNPAFRQIFTSLFIPDGTAEQMQWWNDLQRRTTTSPDNAARMRRAWDDIDITDLLPRIQCPTWCFTAATTPRSHSMKGAGLPPESPGALRRTGRTQPRNPTKRSFVV